MDILIDEPNEKQKLFLSDRHRHIAFGGARGGGKSWAVRTKAKLLAFRYSGIRILIVRRSYPELINNHINILRAELQNAAVYNDRDKVLKFINGSSINFMYCDSDNDLYRLQGVEYDVIFIDEATQLSEFQMKTIAACIRGANRFPKRMYYTCNPGGKGHAYIKRVFIDRKFQDGENPDDYGFIQSLVTDNTALMKYQPDYINQLEALPPKLREAWLYGRWDIFDGQFFDDFVIGDEKAQEERKFTHVIKPFDLSSGDMRGWNIYRSYDFGYNKPFSCAWWAVDYDGVIYRILELYGCTNTPNEGVRWTPEKQFQEIRRIEREHPWLNGRDIHGVADPSIWDASRGESVADTAARYGIYFSPGDNKRIAGWMQCHYRLQFDNEGYPRMYVFNNCRAFIRTIPELSFSSTNPEDLDTSGEDHAADEWRYFCMERPVRPILKSENIIISDPLNMFSKE